MSASRGEAISLGKLSNAALFEGKVFHDRPGGERRKGFDLRIAMPFVDLDEVDQAINNKHRRWSPIQFRQTDYLDDRDIPLADFVRDRVLFMTGDRPNGRVMMLGHVRTWGWLFNPIVCYFCYDESDSEVEALLIEVRNTPWKERHCYVVGPPGKYERDKEFHVSPFLPMNLAYTIDYSVSDDDIAVQFDVHRGDVVHMRALLRLQRSLAKHRQLHLLFSYPFMTMRVSAGIYCHAAMLAAKRTTFFQHPKSQRSAIWKMYEYLVISFEDWRHTTFGK